MTEKFVSAAALMSEVLGAPGHPFVVIPHPISSASQTALDQAAKAAAADCVAIIVGDTTNPDESPPSPGA